MQKIRYLTNLLLVFVFACIFTFAFLWAMFFQYRFFQDLYLGNATTEQCFSPALLNETAPCASCVHFVSFVVFDSGRWKQFDNFLRALRVMASSLRISQKCFRLNLYTNLPLDGRKVLQLIQAGGVGVEVRALPKLPANRYTKKSRWLALSRSKLDLVEHYATITGVDPVWTDMDTLVLTDLSCAVGRARNFAVTRDYPQHTIVGPRGSVLLHPKRSVYGDLWMMDSTLRNAVRALENSGMPPPSYDIQDYLSLLMNRCDGTVLDLRSLVRANESQKASEMCFGFDAAHGHHPKSNNLHLMVRDGQLRCMKKEEDDVKLRPVATLSFVAHHYWGLLRNPNGIFNTPELRKWAERRGFYFKRK